MTEIPLSRLAPGCSARVVRVVAEGDSRRRLQEMGLVSGASVSFVRAAPLGDPIEVRVRGYHLSLRTAEAEKVIVRANEML